MATSSKRARLEMESPTSELESQKDEDNLIPIQHPLLNPLILKNVYQFCDRGSLKKCRLVATVWNQVASNVFRKRNYSVQFYTARKIVSFTAIARTSSNLLYKNFLFHWETCRTQHNGVVENFFEVCNDFIEELFLPLDYEYHDSKEPKERLVIIPSIILPKMVNLRHFSLEMEHAVPELLEGAAQDLWNRKYLGPLFLSIPNVRKITLINRVAGYVNSIATHTKWAANIITCLQQLEFLEELTLEAFVSDHNLESLRSLHLKCLRMNLYNSRFKNESLTEFLKSQQNTLEHLEIYESNIHEFQSNFTVEFPCMEKLKSLMVGTRKGAPHGIKFLKISYLQMFPNLQTLVYNNRTGEITEDWFLAPSVTISELKFYGNFSLSSSIVLEITNSFVALRKLEIYCNKVCQHIFKHLSTLEDLALLNCDTNENLDVLLTGFEIEEHKDVKYTPFDKRSRPSIGLLLNLKILTIEGCSSSNPNQNEFIINMTDFSGYHAFLQMPSLKVLNIAPSRISETCIEDMGKQFLVLPVDTTADRWYKKDMRPQLV